jgi:hypothetical protein
MFQNKPNFIPKRYRRPDRYERLFSNWTAVYEIGGETYYVELESHVLNCAYANAVSIRVQTPEGRSLLIRGIPSVKQAMEEFEWFIERRGKIAG